MAPVPGAAPEPSYHNFLWEGLSGTLHRVQDVIAAAHSSSPAVSAGGTDASAMATAAVGGAAQQLGTAAERLRSLAQQLGEVSLRLGGGKVMLQAGGE